MGSEIPTGAATEQLATRALEQALHFRACNLLSLLPSMGRRAGGCLYPSALDAQHESQTVVDYHGEA